MSLIVRLLSKVKVNPETGCWERGKNKRYAKFQCRSGGIQQAQLAHRVSYSLTHGPISDLLLVCHHCDNPRCINPEHLFAGSYKDNYDDMAKKGRAAKAGGRPRDKKTTAVTGFVIRAYDMGMLCLADIARKCGLSSGMVRHVLKREGRRPIGLRGRVLVALERELLAEC